ncbi:MAG: alpha-ribazole phosphatase family protein [Gammaproteobacteria bacterium]
MLLGRSRRPASRDTSASPRVGLLRHGETEGGQRFRGHTDDPLTPAGLSQMYAAIAESGRWDRVISSPLLRCSEFSSAFAQQRSLPLIFDIRLKEIHFGQWEGRSAAELMAEDPESLERFWRDPDIHPPPGGESLARFQARVLDAWNNILSAYAGQRVLTVTHGGVIRVLLCHVFEVPVSRWSEFEVPLGKLHSVHIGGGKACLYRKRSDMRPSCFGPC